MSIQRKPSFYLPAYILTQSFNKNIRQMHFLWMILWKQETRLLFTLLLKCLVPGCACVICERIQSNDAPTTTKQNIWLVTKTFLVKLITDAKFWSLRQRTASCSDQCLIPNLSLSFQKESICPYQTSRSKLYLTSPRNINKGSFAKFYFFSCLCARVNCSNGRSRIK